jgi:cardiolipin synthase
MTRPFFAPRSTRWVPGNHFELLENGEEFFPACSMPLPGRHEVMLETFILFEDKIGQQLHAALLGAAQRGVEVHVLVDGFGSPDLSEQFVGRSGGRRRAFPHF